MLQQMWGDELPPGPASALTALIDAVGIDDFHGVEDRVVSQGDGVSYQVLAVLWQHYLNHPPLILPPCSWDQVCACHRCSPSGCRLCSCYLSQPPPSPDLHLLHPRHLGQVRSIREKSV